MSELGAAAAFAAELYRYRAQTALDAYVRRNKLALLQMRPGRVNPYAIYGQLRTAGTIFPGRYGGLATPSHRVCNTVLRDRRFGARPPDGFKRSEQDSLEASFLTMNPPDHTRLRKQALPAFSPRAVAGYSGHIEQTAADLLGKAARADRFDLVADFAAALPIAVITDLLGIPDANAAEFAQYGALLSSAIDGVSSLRHAAQLIAAQTKINTLVEAARRRASGSRSARGRSRPHSGRWGPVRSDR